MSVLTAGELRSLIAMTAGDAHERKIPTGMIAHAAQTSLDAISTLAIQCNIDLFRDETWLKVPPNKEVFDLPPQVGAIEQITGVLSAGLEPKLVKKVDAASEVQATIVGPTYFWHYVGPRRFRFSRPDVTQGWDPGLRLKFLKRLFYPPDPNATIELPSGGEEFVRFRAATLLAGAPGAQVDLSVVNPMMLSAKEELIRALSFNDAAAPAPIPEDADRW